jgi:hypothetical protein
MNIMFVDSCEKEETKPIREEPITGTDLKE